MQQRIVLVGDQDLGDVALGLEPQLDRAVAERLLEIRETKACRAVTVLCRAVDADRLQRSADQSALGACGSRSTRRAASRSCYRRRAPEREAAAAIRELRAVDRASARRARPGAPAVAARGDHVPYLGELLRVVPQPGRTRVHRRGVRAAGARRRRALAGARALVPAGRARRDRAAARPACARGGTLLLEADDPRPADAVGELLAQRGDELQLAAAAGARAGARLRRLARGLPPRGDGPLAPLLGAAGVATAPDYRERRPGCDGMGRRWSCSTTRGLSRARGAAPRRPIRRGAARSSRAGPAPCKPRPSRRRARRLPP